MAETSRRLAFLFGAWLVYGASTVYQVTLASDLEASTRAIDLLSNATVIAAEMCNNLNASQNESYEELSQLVEMTLTGVVNNDLAYLRTLVHTNHPEEVESECFQTAADKVANISMVAFHKMDPCMGVALTKLGQATDEYQQKVEEVQRTLDILVSWHTGCQKSTKSETETCLAESLADVENAVNHIIDLSSNAKADLSLKLADLVINCQDCLSAVNHTLPQKLEQIHAAAELCIQKQSS